jgi:hypothetical protein
MKHHPGWLAAGLLIFAVLACNLNKNSNNSNNSNSNTSSTKSSTPPVINRPANADVYVRKIYMARDKNGEPGLSTTSFEPGDRTIHCVIELNKGKSGTTVKFVWRAVDVAGMKNEEVKTIDYTTRSFENKVHGHLTLPYDWPKGKYRVEIYINSELDKTIDYTVG